MRRYVFACVVAVAMAVTPASGQAAARVEKSAAAPDRGAKLDARIPQLIAYQGKLTDSTGRPVDDGSYVMVFSLSADSIGSSFWHETQAVETKGGLFNILLGSKVPIFADSIPRGGCYLGIRVLPSTEEFHRQRIVSVPFAFQADNSDRLQGRDSAALDSVYISHTDTNAVTSALIEDGTITKADVASSFTAPYADTADYARLASDSARVAANAHLLQGKDTTALWNAKTLQGKDTASFVRTGQPDAVTSAMIVPNTIVRADVATNFKAPFSDTADYANAAPASDSAGVAGNSHLLQGKDTVQLNASYVNEGQASSVTSPMICDTTVSAVHIKDSAVTAPKIATGAVTAGKIAAGAVGSTEISDNSVTGADIHDGTITSMDIAASGVVAGTYGDGYHVPRITVDSVGRLTAAEDTTILGAAPTGPAGGDLTGNYPNPTIAASKVTSAKIVDGTIARSDVAASFKAPYADTADYAAAAPASDSARVAGNSHLLQGKDTTSLWNAKTLQGKDTTALWNAKRLQGKDTTALWNAKTLQGKDTSGFVRAGQADAVTSAMIAPNTIVRADVAANFKAPYSDTADYAKVAPASDSARVAGNSHLLQTKDTTALWNAKTLQGKDTTLLWNAKTLQGKDTTALWNAKKLQGKDTTGFVRASQPDAVTSAMIVNGTIARVDVATNFKAPYADTADYAKAAPAADSAAVAGNSHLLLGKDTTALWNAKTLQGKDTTVLWNAKTLQGKDTTALWNAKKLQGKDTTGFVRTGQPDAVTSAMIAPNTIVRADVAANFKAPYSDTADYAKVAPASDSARVAGNSHLLLGKDTTALWNAKTLQGKDTTALSNAKKLQGKDTTDLWNAKTLQGKDTSALWNAKTLQGKDTTGFVRTDQANSITSAMITDGNVTSADIQDTTVNTADLKDSAVTKSKISVNAVDSAKIANGSVTGADIKDRTITSADIALSGVAAGTYGDGYHVARITVDSTGRLTAAADTTILGAAPSGPAGGDLTGNYPNPTIAADKVTSAKILDGTIVRVDVATGFKAPYSDTSDYAKAAPASDSARVAGNSHLLQNKDTTALWNAKVLQGKDTTALWNAKTLQGKDTTGFVRTGQADAVTSAMIVNGTIVRSDVATGFKAPYADTADYAITAPASDSARVSGNSHLLQGKDTTALWNAKTLQGKDTAALWNAKKLQGKDTTDLWNAKTLQGKDTAALWNAKRLQGKDTTALWNAKKLQGKDTTGFVRASQPDAVTSAMIVNGTIARVDVATSFKAPFADTADYAKAAPAADSATVAGNSHLLLGKDTTALWNAKTLQGKDTTGFVRTGQASSITSGMIANNDVTLSKIERGTNPDSGMAVVSQGSGNNPVWGYPAAVGNTSPTTMRALRFGTVNVDFPSTSGPAFAETTATIAGAAVGDLVFLTSTASFSADFILCATCEVTGANTIRVRAYLPSNTTIDPDDDDMRYVLIKP